MAILQGHVIGLNPDHGLPLRQFFDRGIQVRRRLLSEAGTRRQDHPDKNGDRKTCCQNYTQTKVS
jgi:hypothetical protein